MRTRVLLAVVVCIGGGCQPSPDDLLFVVGQVVTPTEAVVPNVAIALRRSKNEFCFGRRGLSSSLTVSVQRPDYEDFLSDTTDAEGHFLFEMMLAEAQVSSGNGFGVSCFALRDPEGRSEIQFQHPLTDVNIPGLLQWDTPLTWKKGVNTLKVSLREPLPILPGIQNGPEAPAAARDSLLLASHGGSPFWLTQLPRNPDTSSFEVEYEPELFEDYLAPEAFVELEGISRIEALNPFQSQRTTFSALVQSRPLALPKGTLVPMSRGAKCAVASPCPFTDGKLDVISATVSTPTGVVSNVSLAVILPAPTRIRFVVVRNLTLAVLNRSADQPVDVILEGTVDGSSWIPIGTVGQYPPETSWATSVLRRGYFFAGSFRAGGPVVTAVRISTGTQAAILSLAELSLYD